MSKNLKFYLNLALVGFAVGRSFGAYKKRAAPGRRGYAMGHRGLGRLRWN